MSKLDYVNDLIRMARRIAVEIPSEIRAIPLESEDHIPVEVEEIESADLMVYEQVRIELPMSISNAIESAETLHYLLDDEENTIALQGDLNCVAFVEGVGEGEDFRKALIAITMPAVTGFSFIISDDELGAVQEEINLKSNIIPAMVDEANLLETAETLEAPKF